ncbi:MAG: hypothetical protein KDA17_06575, partial [Candidatus Saccharibacteria bacterium]|nr:hypothetical protein [Candidatus Saccharibacteria bacterium]
MNRRTITLTTFVVIVAGLIFAQLAAAMTVPGLSVTLECNRYTYGTFTYIADRDNTGNNKERTYIRVMDGLGTVLFNDQFDTTLGSYPAV